MSLSLHDALAGLPLVAILRGVTPEEVEAIGAALVEAGFRCIEVPLNSPRPFDSIRRLADRFGREALIGAGTVLKREDVARVQASGGNLIVMPHADVEVIAEAKRLNLVCAPGAATPTEAFAALKAGADAVKIFPAEAVPPAVVKAWRAVVPASVPLIAVGGITPDRMAAYRDAGTTGFGLGSALYKPGMTATEVAATAASFAQAWRSLQG
ncbi:2-dehydro-3-deoxy-6-phosphogalactonate aldolase [Inquilinus sp. NPDC058860]|uniref:2-dehydro-3-deoxy-6-phosphogalactonate aldolase n=1 Tax=Inquilinus sp. NPDC058860 TaxID=3346652 RepID=UPI003691E80F